MSRPALELQSEKIDEYRYLANPYKKTLAGLTIEVLPGVYPGGTDSELLAENLEVHPGDTVLDLCTGNGIVAFAAAKKGALSVLGTDLNPEAIRNAKRNKQLLGVTNVGLIETDLYPQEGVLYDTISINPPYTDNQADDKTAICFWDKDNATVKTFFKKLKRYMKPSGKAYITWASFADPELLGTLASAYGFELSKVKSREGNSGFIYTVYLIRTML